MTLKTNYNTKTAPPDILENILNNLQNQEESTSRNQYSESESDDELQGYLMCELVDILLGFQADIIKKGKNSLPNKK